MRKDIKMAAHLSTLNNENLFIIKTIQDIKKINVPINTNEGKWLEETLKEYVKTFCNKRYNPILVIEPPCKRFPLLYTVLSEWKHNEIVYKDPNQEKLSFRLAFDDQISFKDATLNLWNIMEINSLDLFRNIWKDCVIGGDPYFMIFEKIVKLNHYEWILNE